MKSKKQSYPYFAVCIDNAEYPASLEIHKLYRVLQDEEAENDGDIRIIDESGEDYLYPAEYFVRIDLPIITARSINRSFTRMARQTA